MPTFNQLVRKGREQATYKSNSPAMQKGLNTLKNKETDLPSPQKSVHRRSYLYPQEAQLRTAEDRPCASDQWL